MKVITWDKFFEEYQNTICDYCDNVFKLDYNCDHMFCREACLEWQENDMLEILKGEWDENVN